ncbi:hypothetical protein PC129_g4160 [Phytophthora cactorum]|uniref:Uncharacterized protein n=1 Tax=Phytophthora cactorum TaxID=29920 RepID=A0A329T0L9_9STRA|nr:hypothetical protein Pcac1_g20625 [Phytophthora cactorum]KAG2837455.1 hypothetical protein PC112_g4908 [Phytophthora cactorum]KAG2918711.1 hypothetical protein PC114_g6727 [Phytophthora cactorum]KAG2946776.1 hypothetical protein PC117_g7376 [Phytophthora cactorum]KAG3136920.1 hypothetical protein C6341_g21201 [Phytophthora cactorum]
MASVNDDYEESWESAEASVDKKSMVCAIDGQVLPVESGECNARDVEPAQPEEHEFPVGISADMPQVKMKEADEAVKDVHLTTKVNETIGADICVVSAEMSSSEDTVSSVENEIVSPLDAREPKPKSPDLPGEHSLVELVRIHGHHYNHHTPPPVPVTLSVSTETKSPSKPDIGALQARVAAKRIAEFKRRQALKAERERGLESAWAQKRREIRHSNEAMHRALGVAGLSAQDHLRIAQRRRKQETKENEIAASLERQHRWYNCTPKRPVSAPDHVRQLNLQHCRTKREFERSIERKQKSIQANQLRLRQEVKEIIAKTSGPFVRGSYLLKVTHHTIKTQSQPSPNDQKDIGAGQQITNTE